MYGSLTTKELKKKHSSRLVGVVEIGSQAERTHSKAVAGGPGWARWQLADPARQQLADWAVPHSCADKPGGTTGQMRQTMQPRAPAQGK